MRLILARHGNTFNEGESARFIGRNEDLPLTSYGQQQAVKVALLLRERGLIPSRVFSSPLLRTLSTAQIVCRELGLIEPPVIDNRLLEIDYGRWSNLREDQVDAQQLLAWREHGEWPVGVDISPSRETILRETEEFLASLNDELTLAVTSNGRIRWYYHLESGRSGPSVKTGAICLLEKRLSWQVLEWNQIEPSI